MKQKPRAGGARASEVDPAGRRRNPTAAPSEPQAPLDAVAVFAPWAGPDERALRLGIHKARDISQARATQSKHGRARSVYWLAAQMAGDWVFRRAAIEDLQDIRVALIRLFQVASTIKRLEAPDE